MKVNEFLYDSPDLIHANDKRATFCGSPLYVSPEMINGDAVSYECDIWALGIIVHRLIIGTFPFDNNSDFLRFEAIVNKNIQFD